MKKQILLLTLGFCMALMIVASIALAKPEYAERSGHDNDCYFCHDQDQGSPTATSLTETGRAYRAEGHPAGTPEDPWEPTATGDQYGEWDGSDPIQDPLGNVLSLEPVLQDTFSGVGILGGFFGGEKGGFVQYNTGPLLESATRGSTQGCTNAGCHQDYVDQDHYMNMRPASGSDCYLCHTKHVACAACHEMGKPGDSITRMINGRLDAFGVPLELPPVIDETLREVPLIDVHKAINHGGLIGEYAPGDLGAVFDTTRALTGDDESHYLAGTIRETDNTLQDESMFKLNELPLIGQEPASQTSAAAPSTQSPIPQLPIPEMAGSLGGLLDTNKLLGGIGGGLL